MAESPLTGVNIENEGELREYLERARHVAQDDVLEVRVLAGGVSSRTVWVDFRDRPAWVLKQALPRLRVQMEWFSDPRRVHCEALGLRTLQELLPAGSVPRFLFEDRECHLLAMEAVPEPHANWKSMLLAGNLESKYIDQFAVLLASLHRQAWLRRVDLAGEFSDRTYFETLRLEPYYRCSAQQCEAARPFLHQLIANTLRRSHTLVHGDYSPKNILVREGRLVLLDHEVIHWGDPAFDVGFALTHLLSKAHHCREHREAFCQSAERFWRRYEAELGDVPWRVDVEAQAIDHTLGCLLARAIGRSPLEYLSASERTRQQRAVLRLIAARPDRLDQLPGVFLVQLERECP
jgi:5-methylthioribose kinase